MFLIIAIQDETIWIGVDLLGNEYSVPELCVKEKYVDRTHCDRPDAREGLGRPQLALPSQLPLRHRDPPRSAGRAGSTHSYLHIQKILHFKLLNTLSTNRDKRFDGFKGLLVY